VTESREHKTGRRRLRELETVRSGLHEQTQIIKSTDHGIGRDAEGASDDTHVPAKIVNPSSCAYSCLDSGCCAHPLDEARMPNGGTSQTDEERDTPPAGIDLPLGKAQSAGRGGSVVIVVEPLAHHEPG